MEMIRLKRALWEYDANKPLGPEGGFGAVYSGSNENGEQVAVKRLKISATEAAHRELRIADELAGKAYTNIMPILDAGQDADSDRYFIVMPCAEKSLQDHIDEHGQLDERMAAGISLEIAQGLEEALGFVHRDLKPGNILFHNGHWKIADFGIARFIEEATSLRTLKECLSPLYAAPEQWRLEHATSATDIYALGCIGYALLTGHPPFAGPTVPDLQNQHLNQEPPPLPGKSPKLRSLLSMLLRKSPATRPSVPRIKSILTSFLQENIKKPEGKAWGYLEKVGAEVAEQEGQAEAKREKEISKQQRRNSLYSAAIQIIEHISAELLRRIMDSAPSAKGNKRGTIALGGAVLEISPMTINPIGESAFSQSGWDVVAGAVVKVRQSAPPYEWSASLWYSKQHEKDEYRWREVSYFTNAFSRDQRKYEPYFFDDINAADLAASQVMSGYQIAWGPAPIDDEDVEAFYERWADLFARAVRGQLQHPGTLPLR